MTKDWHDFQNRLISEADVKGIPLVGQFELTARCNLKCKMCYVQEPNKTSVIKLERSAVEWIKLIGQARDAGMLYVLLTGGEVFIRPDFKEIYDEVSQMGVQTTIYTNGTLITPDIAKWFGRIPPAKIEISLYGASAETYGKVTGHPEAFDQALRGIDLLLHEGINIKLRTTVVKDNADDFDKLNKLADDRNLLMHYCYYISPRRDSDGHINSNLRLEPDELAAYEYKAGTEYEKRVNKILKRSNTSVISVNDDIFDSPGGCSAAKSEFWVTWDGKLTPCGGLNQPATYPFENGFREAWELIRREFESMAFCNPCATCDLLNICWTCKARLKNETGRFDISAPYLCEWAKKRKELNI